MRITLRTLACLVLVWCCFPAEAKASTIVFDPLGDTLAFTPGFPDITSVESIVTSDTITFVIRFANVIAPYIPGGGVESITPNTIAPYIDLDTDQNPATGFVPYINIVTESRGLPPVSLGSEFTISSGGSETPNDAWVRTSPFFPPTFTVPNAVTYEPMSVSFNLPLALLNDDGRMNYGVFVWGGVAVPSDRAPNGTTPFSTVPEPTTLLLLGAAGAVFVARGSIKIPARRKS
jgi:hypothetical protein